MEELEIDELMGPYDDLLINELKNISFAANELREILLIIEAEKKNHVATKTFYGEIGRIRRALDSIYGTLNEMRI